MIKDFITSPDADIALRMETQPVELFTIERGGLIDRLKMTDSFYE